MVQQRRQLGVHLRQPHRGMILLVQPYGPGTQVQQPGTAGSLVHFDAPVSRKLRAAVDPEHPHSPESTLSPQPLSRYNRPELLRRHSLRVFLKPIPVPNREFAWKVQILLATRAPSLPPLSFA